MTEEELDNQEIQIITLQDSEGQDRDFEILSDLEFEGNRYYALLPYYDNVEDLDNKDEEDTEILIMRATMDGDDEILETIEDDDLFDKVAAMFDAKFDEQDAMYGDEEPAEEQ